MIDEYEFYHGAVLRNIIVESKIPVTIKVDDIKGRVDSFVINDRVAIYIKHSAKRLTPWQFTFSRDNVEELVELDRKYESLFVCLVCDSDGIVVLSPDEFLKITGPSNSEVYGIRLDRTKRSMYSAFGNDGKLEYKLARGVARIVETIERPQN